MCIRDSVSGSRWRNGNRDSVDEGRAQLETDAWDEELAAAIRAAIAVTSGPHDGGAKPAPTGTQVKPLQFVLHAPAASEPDVSDEVFETLLDELASKGLWASLDEDLLALSREENLRHRTWTAGQLDDKIRVPLDLDALQDQRLDKALGPRVVEQWANHGLELRFDHHPAADHDNPGIDGFRAVINDEPLSYGPGIETILRPLTLINWLADRDGIGSRLYLAGEFTGWSNVTAALDLHAAYLLSRDVAELIQTTPVLDPANRLIPVEALTGQVHEWKIR